MNKKNTIEFLKTNKIKYDLDVSFKELTTYKCGGNALIVSYPKDVLSLTKLIKYLKEENISFKVFGNGSNILASDKIYHGVIIKLSLFNKLEIDSKLNVTVGAGYSLSKLANCMSKKGYSGLEFACGIPGTIGGAIYMNAGAYLHDMAGVTTSVLCLNENYDIVTLSNDDLCFAYRSSILHNGKYICLEANLKLKRGNKVEICKIIRDRMFRRLDSQPLSYPSAGSVFRNPTGDYAGRLIEECHLKGKKKGGAEISSKHANFIVNIGDAKAGDVKYLMDLVQKKVKDRFNVDLRREQELFNWE